MQKADHSGHRSRMKKKYIDNGIDIFEPHEVLEILLYYAVPQKNTNDLAKNLIAHFGSLSAVFDASISSLMNFGLSEHQAVLMKLIPDVTRKYMTDKYRSAKGRIPKKKLPDYVFKQFIGLEKEERILLILMDKTDTIVYSEMIAHGDPDNVSLNIRKIVALAAEYSATMAYIAHNHPSGLALPSKNDVIVTYSLRDALHLIRVKLADHFLVAGGKCISLVDSGILVFDY